MTESSSKKEVRGVGPLELPCAECGQTCRKTASRMRKNQNAFCSQACYWDYRRRTGWGNRQPPVTPRTRLSPYVSKICDNPSCSVLVERRKSETLQRLYCSRICSVTRPQSDMNMAAQGRPPTLPSRGIDPDSGYAWVRLPIGHAFLPRGRMPEHRFVMAQHLGRPLTENEHVLHRNGVRHDNRLSKLELWTVPHPYGQRVTDLVAWAKEIIEKYESELPLLT